MRLTAWTFVVCFLLYPKIKSHAVAPSLDAKTFVALMVIIHLTHLPIGNMDHGY